MERENWTQIISPTRVFLQISLCEIWRYRDLLFLLVKRDFVAVYKQTILGPLWFFIQPVFTTMIFTIIFSRVAKISTEGVQPVLFYLAGITAWNYFADCLNKTSNTFAANVGIFGKVYFPRLIVPLSIVISSLIKFGIQFLLFLLVLFWFLAKGNAVNPGPAILLTPLLLVLMAGLGLGAGMLIASMTTKYRDLQFLVGFGVQLLMYATPVIYPLSLLDDYYRVYAELNPMAFVLETFRYAYIGTGTLQPTQMVYSFVFMITLFIVGLIVFHRVEKNFMDTI